MPKLIGVALVLALVGPPQVSQAAACCTSATAFGTGRLLMWESWAAGFRSNFSHEIGYYGSDHVFERSDPDSVDQRMRLDAYALYATSEHGAVFVVVPWLFPRLGDANQINIGSNLADIQVGYRHQIIAIGEYEELPSLAFTGSLLVPSGMPRNRGTKPHEVTGKDALVLMAGASLERTWMPFFVQLNLGTSLLFNQIRTQNETPDKIAHGFEVAIATGMELTQSLVASLMGSWTYEYPSKWKTEASASLAWQVNPHFTVQANATSHLLAPQLGSDWPGNISYGFGIRYGYF